MPEARRYFKLSADKNVSFAQYYYAKMLRDEMGGTRDLPEARKYFKLSADQGYSYAQYEYAVMLRDGLGGDEDLNEAKEYLRLSADQQDNSDAQYSYALMIRDEDLVEAKRYFQLAADNGHRRAKIAYDLLLAEDQNSPLKLAEDGSGSK